MITVVTNASAENDAATAQLVAALLPQRAFMMSRSQIDGATGALTILLDERNVPPLEELVG